MVDLDNADCNRDIQNLSDIVFITAFSIWKFLAYIDSSRYILNFNSQSLKSAYHLWILKFILQSLCCFSGFQGDPVVKNPCAKAGDVNWGCPGTGGSREEGVVPTPVFLPGESHAQRGPAGYSPWGRKEQDTTELT